MSRRRNYSAWNDPDFRYLAIFIVFILAIALYGGYDHGGVIGGVKAVFETIYNLGYTLIWLTFLLILILFTVFRRDVIIAILKWAWNQLITTRKRNGRY